MKTLFQQFAAIITPRIARLNETAAPVVAEDIKGRMLENTAEGKAFGNDAYVNTYTKAYAKRRAQPPQFPKVAPVILRNKDNALETANVNADRTGAVISFKDKGRIFRYHHTGNVRGGRVRSIFPKSLSSVPRQVHRLAQRSALEVLRG